MTRKMSGSLRITLAFLMIAAFQLGVPLPARAATLTLDPAADSNPVGTSHTVTFTVLRDDGTPAAGLQARFAVPSGPNAGQQSDLGECSVRPDCRTDGNGRVSWTYTSNGIAGTDVIEACVGPAAMPKCARATKEWVAPSQGGAAFLIIDEDGIDNGLPPNFFSPEDVNDDIAELAVRSQLRYFASHIGSTITLYTGQVGDEGWFAPETIPDSWRAAGPTPDGIRNFVGNPSQPFPHNVGPGLGTPDSNGDRESLLDKIPDVNPLRATGLELLEGRSVCAVVYDSDVSINYGPLNGSLKGANLGTVAFRVVSVTRLEGHSSSSLPQVELVILDANEVCEGPLQLFTEAPEPTSSSEPFDVVP